MNETLTVWNGFYIGLIVGSGFIGCLWATYEAGIARSKEPR